MALFKAALLGLIAPTLSFSAGAARAPRTRSVDVRMEGPAVGDKFPAPALSKFGCSGKKSVIFFYGADNAPSCEKQIMAMDAALPEFKEMGVNVVGVRNPAGVKLTDDADRLKLVVDEDDAVRNQLEIPKDFFVLGGRQTYVVDATGTIAAIHNNQFDPASHVSVSLDAAKELPSSGGFPFELPDFSSLFGGK